MTKCIAKRLKAVWWSGLFVLVALTPIRAQNADERIGQEVKKKGVVVERTGDLLLLRNVIGVETPVRIGSRTEFEEKKKNFMRDPLKFASSDIVRGLRVEVKGYWGPSGAVEAEEIKFTHDDLKVAKVVDSRLVPVESRLQMMESESDYLSGQLDELGSLTRLNRAEVRQAQQTADQAQSEAQSAHRRVDEAERQIGALDSRFSDLVEFDVKDTLTILFEAGSAKLSPDAEVALKEFAAYAFYESGFLVEVTGFASADGNPEFNRRLSEKRASEVVRYLAEKESLPLRCFVTPHGFGENRPVADNATKDGRVQNRRVEVRLLVNRGLNRKSQLTGAWGDDAKTVFAESIRQ